MRFGPPSPRITFSFDGQTIEARPGETVATALHAARLGPPIVCAMGVCQQCCIRSRGRIVESCRLFVEPGMVFESVP
ncbi:MAG: 2Fe-2S iron-sulfur cluster-binding protein [Pseudomonadota bacterium]